MYLRELELCGFKSFARKTKLVFENPITAIVGPNGSGKSNIAEAFRWVLGEQSIKSLRGKRGEDLIFSGAGKTPRQNRANVSVCFDNTKRNLDIDFDEVVIERAVYRDGTNDYTINKSPVRLKNILELTGKASIGTGGHYVIRQGEADRILNARPKERREMIEEALGLRIFHWKIAESKKKLDKTNTNIKEIESIRREIAGHLRFLKRGVEQAEKSVRMRSELVELLTQYFKKEELYLSETLQKLSTQRAELARKLSETEDEMGVIDDTANNTGGENGGGELRQIEQSLLELRDKKLTAVYARIRHPRLKSVTTSVPSVAIDVIITIYPTTELVSDSPIIEKRIPSIK